MISNPGYERPETYAEEIEAMELDRKIDEMIDKAKSGDQEAIELMIEPIGNDDETTKAFIELMSLARVDSCESPASKDYSPKAAHVRLQTRNLAFKKLTELADQYYAKVLGDE